MSLAIGKEGLNARLAAKLTGWRIDIKSETQAPEENGSGEEAIRRAEGWKPRMAAGGRASPTRKAEAAERRTAQIAAGLIPGRARRRWSPRLAEQPYQEPYVEGAYAEGYEYVEGYPGRCLLRRRGGRWLPRPGDLPGCRDRKNYSQMVWDETAGSFVEYVPGVRYGSSPEVVAPTEAVPAAAGCRGPVGPGFAGSQEEEEHEEAAKAPKKKAPKDKKRRIDELQEEYGEDYEAL